MELVIFSIVRVIFSFTACFRGLQNSNNEDYSTAKEGFSAPEKLMYYVEWCANAQGEGFMHKKVGFRFTKIMKVGVDGQ